MKKDSTKIMLIILLAVVILLGGIFTSKYIYKSENAKESSLNNTEDNIVINNNELEENNKEEQNEEKENTSGNIGEGQESVFESGTRDELIDSLTRYDNQGLVSVDAIFKNPIEDNEKYIVFEMYFNTHSVNLDQYNLGKAVEFKTSEGIVSKENIIWEKGEGAGGHHYYGYYKIPKNIEGKTIISKEVSSMELHIKGIDDVEDRVFQWGKEDINLYVNK